MVSNADQVSGYADWMMEKVHQGWVPTMLTFMFNPLPGSASSKAAQMDRDIERVYGRMVTRAVRDTRARRNQGRLPIWIVSPDWPVPKYGMKRDHLRNIAVNDGQHRHALALTPPWSRFGTDLGHHIDCNQSLYMGSGYPLFRLHFAEITKQPRKTCRYILKSLERGRIKSDDIMILPKAVSELTTLTSQERAATREDRAKLRAEKVLLANTSANP